jgi:hypothetical protein
MELTFTGNITEIQDVKTGTSKAGNEWASATFEVTEANPKNPDYPQIALFDFFKSGEYLDMAKDFKNKFKLGETVTVYFNFKKNEYTKDGQTRAFYKTSAWKIDKLSKGVPAPDQAFEPAGNLNEAEDDLPF